jgi:DNA-binding NarL/FixJ family response regulator
VTHSTHRLVLADDHTIVREGLRLLLSAVPGVEVVGEAADGRSAVQIAVKLQPDLLVTDLSMPGISGMASIREIKRRCAHTRVLVLTVHRDYEYVSASLSAGADGYVLKDAGRDELISAVNSVLNGKAYLSPDVAGQIVEGFVLGHPSSAGPASMLGKLTDRERDVLKLVAEGRTNKEAADYLCVSVKTVEKHRANLKHKLGIHRTAELVSFAVESGVLRR